MMRLRALLAALLLGVAAVLGSGAGCSFLTGTGPGSDRDVEHIIASLDSLHVPARIATTDTLEVRMRGTVGPNSCYTFDHFDVQRSSDRLTVTPIVEHVVKEETACLTVVMPLTKTYEAGPPFKTGPLTVVVPQPDRPDVRATVEVQ